jgi:hypothetical protein
MLNKTAYESNYREMSYTEKIKFCHVQSTYALYILHLA